MSNLIKIFLTSLITLVTMDSLWLLLIAPKFYKAHIGFLLADKPNLIAALIFYFLYVVGLIVFVIQPGLAKGSLLNTVLMGALFGLVCYATYDLTNMATVKNWPVIVTVVDLIWGIFLSSVISGVVFAVISKLNS